MILTDTLVAHFAKVGGAVFYGDLMMSQWGVDKDGNKSSNYDQYPDNFTPNLMMNFKDGSLTANNAFVKGVIASNYVNTEEAKYIGENRVLDVEKNTNIFSGFGTDVFPWLYLPTSLKYTGFKVTIYNSGGGQSEYIPSTGKWMWTMHEIEVLTDIECIANKIVKDENNKITTEYTNNYKIKAGEVVEFMAVPTGYFAEKDSVSWIPNKIIALNV